MRYGLSPPVTHMNARSHVSKWYRMGAVASHRRRLFGQQLELPPDEGEVDDDVIDFPGTGTGERVPEDDLPPDFIAPGAVRVREANWDLENCKYTIASGDTFVGLAATYLGDGARWREIYQTGNNQSLIPNPDDIRTPGPIDMPQEACDKMKAFLKKGKPPGTLPGEIPADEVKKLTESKAKYYAAAAVGVAAVVGIGIAIAYS